MYINPDLSGNTLIAIENAKNAIFDDVQHLVEVALITGDDEDITALAKLRSDVAELRRTADEGR